jgi:hypothetical protein
MKVDRFNFYTIISLALIFMGIISIIYGYIIPTGFVPINKVVSFGFEITGALFIIASIVLFILLKKNIIKPS